MMCEPLSGTDIAAGQVSLMPDANHGQQDCRIVRLGLYPVVVHDEQIARYMDDVVISQRGGLLHEVGLPHWEVVRIV